MMTAQELAKIVDAFNEDADCSFDYYVIADYADDGASDTAEEWFKNSELYRDCTPCTCWTEACNVKRLIESEGLQAYIVDRT